jgi:hypothetical protein
MADQGSARPGFVVSHCYVSAPGRIRTYNLRIRSPRLYPLSYGRISAVNDTPETIGRHQQPTDFSGLRSTGMGEFQSVGASQSITDHQADIREQAPALLPNPLPYDDGLAAVIEAWDRLPEAIRAGIVAMVRASGK